MKLALDVLTACAFRPQGTVVALLRTLAAALAAAAVAGGLALLPGSSAAAAGSSLPPASASAAESGVELRLSFAPSDVRRYAYDLHAAFDAPELGEFAMDVAMLLVYQVLEVHPDASATVRMSVDRATISLLGQTEDVPGVAGIAVRTRLQPNGSVTEAFLETDSADPTALAGAEAFARGLLALEYPAAPLMVGDSFERQVHLNTPNLPGQFLPLALQSRITLEELAVVEGRQVARLSETTAMPLPPMAPTPDVELSGHLSGAGTHYVDVESGWPLAGDASVAMTMVASSLDGAGPDGAGSITLTSAWTSSYRLE